MAQPKIKRWTFLDTINASVLIAAMLFLVDFNEHATISWLLIAVFALWIVFLIYKNVLISKAEKDPTHPLHNAVKKDDQPK